MHAILYRSTATGTVSSVDIDQIVSSAVSRNALWGITGLLVYGIDADGSHGFAQWIEGDPEDIDNLFALICDDPRHTAVVRIAAGRDLAGYALPTRGQAMRAVAVESLPETAEAFLRCVAALQTTPDPAGGVTPEQGGAWSPSGRSPSQR